MKHIVLFIAAVLLLVGCAGISRKERQALENQNVSPVVTQKMSRGDYLQLEDIIELSRQGVDSQTIIRYLSSTRAVYALDKEGLAQLRKGGVQQDVVDFLLETPNLYGWRAYPGAYYGPYRAPYYPYYYPYYAYPWPYVSTSVYIRGGGHRHR